MEGSVFLGQVKQVIEQYYRRIIDLENRKYDLEKEVEFRDFQVEILATCKGHVLNNWLFA